MSAKLKILHANVLEINLSLHLTVYFAVAAAVTASKSFKSSNLVALQIKIFYSRDDAILHRSSKEASLHVALEKNPPIFVLSPYFLLCLLLLIIVVHPHNDIMGHDHDTHKINRKNLVAKANAMVGRGMVWNIKK